MNANKNVIKNFNIFLNKIKKSIYSINLEKYILLNDFKTEKKLFRNVNYAEYIYFPKEKDKYYVVDIKIKKIPKKITVDLLTKRIKKEENNFLIFNPYKKDYSNKANRIIEVIGEIDDSIINYYLDRILRYFLIINLSKLGINLFVIDNFFSLLKEGKDIKEINSIMFVKEEYYQSFLKLFKKPLDFNLL